MTLKKMKYKSKIRLLPKNHLPPNVCFRNLYPMWNLDWILEVIYSNFLILHMMKPNKKLHK